MMNRFLTLVFAFTCATSAFSGSAKHWDPATAVVDAHRDIAKHHIRFCFIGGYVPHPVGVRDSSLRVVSHYPHIEVGDQGCGITDRSAAEHEYATLYNQEMWLYVSHQPH